MKKVCVFTAIALSGCTTTASYECEQITAELRRMYSRADELAHAGAQPAAYARLRAEHHALREAATKKHCAGTVAPTLEQAAPGASEFESGTGPMIAPPEVPDLAPEVRI